MGAAERAMHDMSCREVTWSARQIRERIRWGTVDPRADPGYSLFTYGGLWRGLSVARNADASEAVC